MDLYWTPKTTPTQLPAPVVKAIASRVSGNGKEQVDVDKSWIPYLEGVTDGGTDCGELIKAINQYGILTIMVVKSQFLESTG